MSSLRNHFNLPQTQDQVRDQRANGAGQLITVIRRDYTRKLTKKMLTDWHKMLMQGSKGITIGKWRTYEEPMQVISGPIGKEKVMPIRLDMIARDLRASIHLKMVMVGLAGPFRKRPYYRGSDVPLYSACLRP